MRVLAFLAAITMIHRIHAIPRQDLAVRQGVNDLSNEKHIFHHLDRNQRTANQDRERVGDVEGSPEADIVKRLVEEREGAVREGVVERRFIRGPDYSQGGSPSDGREPGQSAAKTKPTQQAERGDVANSHT